LPIANCRLPSELNRQLAIGNLALDRFRFIKALFIYSACLVNQMKLNAKTPWRQDKT
jgi:hypothetical protein